MLAGVPVHDAEKELKTSRSQIYTHTTLARPLQTHPDGRCSIDPAELSLAQILISEHPISLFP